MKNITIILFIILIIFLALFFNYKNNKIIETNVLNNNDKDKILNDDSFKLYDHTILYVNNNEISLYIADNNLKKQKGLMNVNELKDDEGMIFLFNEQNKHTFWMKNTLIPLDIIWVDKDKTIVDIITAQPCTSESCPFLYPKAESMYVIELQAGNSDKNNINIGDKLNFDIKIK